MSDVSFTLECAHAMKTVEGANPPRFKDSLHLGSILPATIDPNALLDANYLGKLLIDEIQN